MSNHHYIDDSFRVDKTLDTHGTGYTGRDYDKYPLYGLKCSRKYSGPIYPKKEWKERIAEKTAKKLWMSDQCDRAGSPVKDQNGKSLCWDYAPTRGIEVHIVVQDQPVVVLSPESSSCMINGYKDQGGSGIEAIEYLSKYGCCEERLWPPHKLDRKLDTPEVQENRKKYIITQFEEEDPQDESIWISAVINDDPTSVGIPVWSHEVLLTFLTWNDAKGIVEPGIDNSWGLLYGIKGRSVLQGAYMKFDEVGVIRAITPR